MCRQLQVQPHHPLAAWCLRAYDFPVLAAAPVVLETEREQVRS